MAIKQPSLDTDTLSRNPVEAGRASIDGLRRNRGSEVAYCSSMWALVFYAPWLDMISVTML